MDGPNGRETPRRVLPRPSRVSLWPRPGLRDLTPELLGRGDRPATEIRAREWGLVLTAKGIPYVLRRQGAGLRLLVPRRRVGEALEEIGAYTAERRDSFLPDPQAEVRPASVWLPVLAWMGLITGCCGLLLGRMDFFGRHIDWLGLGAGDSTAMLAGRWERALTALCLHADPAHLFGNAVCGAVFLGLLCRETGVGLGFALTLAAGVGGNVFKALIQGPGMHFLGASTAVFGALGLLGGIRLAGSWPPIAAKRSAAAAAALMLLAMLGAGTGEGGAIDLAGHLFGFLCGAVFGLATGRYVGHGGRLGSVAQVGWGFASIAATLGAWAVALAR